VWAGTHDVVVDGSAVRLTVDPEHLGDLVSALAHHGILALTSQPPTLEELFLARYQDDAEPQPEEQPA
jgi:ABC-2 type transport system ATP-binding protein